MNIPLEKLLALKDEYANQNLSCVYLEDFSAGGRKYRAGDDVTRSDIIHLQKCKIGEIEVEFNERFYNILSARFPLEYRKPYGVMDFLSMDRHLELIGSVSAATKRKRCILTVGDIYGLDQATGRRLVLATHNEPVDYRKWNEMKRFMIKDQRFHYRNSECGIIIFINMKPDAETDYVERFRKNADLVAALVTRKKNVNVDIAPDFIPTEDVTSVTDPEALLDIYRKTNARLIIIGENISETYKRSLLQVKQYDRFARMMVVPVLNPRELEHFLLQVKMVYNSDRWTE